MGVDPVPLQRKPRIFRAGSSKLVYSLASVTRWLWNVPAVAYLEENPLLDQPSEASVLESSVFEAEDMIADIHRNTAAHGQNH
jgi:hypothetical protein